jgi:Ca2+-binding RTX toxin-like protein
MPDNNGFDCLAFVATNGKVFAMAYNPTQPPNEPRPDPIELGSSTGLLPPSITPLSGGGFVTAWEGEGTIRAQVINGNGAKGAAYSFIKPAGGLVDPPVITQLEGGGFAVAFRVDVGNGDDNVYTAAVAADGSIITNTTHVGTSTAGDQWDPSLTSLKGNNYAVSWLSDGGQFFVETIGIAGGGGPSNPGDPGRPGEPHHPPGSSTTWTGTEGNDVRIGTAASETFSGLGGRDSIRGLGGNDTIDGGSGNDKIWGGLGNDVLMGRDGFDVFVFDTKPNKSANKDAIVDYSSLFDSIWLDNKVFTKLGKKGSEKKPAMIKKSMFALEKAKDKDDYIVYSKKKGTISYDADGSGSKYKAVEIATVKKGSTLTHSDFYVI